MSATLWDYQARVGREIAERAEKDVASRTRWQAARPGLYREFMRSMGLDPLPPRCDVRLTDYGAFAGPGYRARRLAWQVLPDCWATGILYLPDPRPDEKLPGVLYTCGHGTIGTYSYQAHAMMWARRGYACLIFDTIEQHDNPGDHHGTSLGKRYDWFSLGYSGATGELWNSIRALDAFSGLAEVDPARLGVTGVSGGGAHSFLLGIADDRVRAVATACGVTVPEQTIRDRHIPNHCDCMYYHNLYGRDPSEFAALIAPRALFYSFAARDTIFSLGEYRGVYTRTKRLYRLLGCGERCAMQIHPIGHGYHPTSHAAMKRWFDRYVAGRRMPDSPYGEMEQKERTTSIFNGRGPSPNNLNLLPELLSPRGAFTLPRSPGDWPAIREAAKRQIRREVLCRLERSRDRLKMKIVHNVLPEGNPSLKYQGELGGMELWAEVWAPAKGARRVIVGVAGEDETSFEVLRRLGAFAGDSVLVGLEPRGAGFTASAAGVRRHLLRAGAITGMMPTLMTIQDLGQVLPFLRRQSWAKGRPLCLYGRGDAGVACIYHAIFDDSVRGLVVEDIPMSHADGAYLLGVLRTCDIEHAFGLFAPRPLGIVGTAFIYRRWDGRVYQRLGHPERFVNMRLDVRTVIEKVAGML
jgi:dienelactone hydrolase